MVSLENTCLRYGNRWGSFCETMIMRLATLPPLRFTASEPWLQAEARAPRRRVPRRRFDHLSPRPRTAQPSGYAPGGFRKLGEYRKLARRIPGAWPGAGAATGSAGSSA